MKTIKQLLLAVLVIVLVLTGIFGYHWYRRPGKAAVKPVAVCGRPLP